ncbi:MAG TPA: EF-P beta-lysylation protein EpmB [Gammaproteobacteria bacterium]|nr:EF-P beta-lysylation protein EpmB [Gammaproteobacteria bacterium]
MAHATNSLKKRQLWQQAMADLITDPAELIHLLNLNPSLLEAAKAAANVFPLRVPRGFAARMEKGNHMDPLLRQVLPLGVELTPQPGYSKDILRESGANPVSGLLHKYPGRVLVTLTSACAVHCRYCFRRFFPYEDNNPGRAGWEKIFDYIESDNTITEVILSGGDPLSANDHLLSEFTERLNQLPHVTRLRIHTRMPVVLPERITDEFMQWAADLTQQLVIVMHINHANEINNEVVLMLKRLSDAGITLLNQSVLLKGVNDDAQTLAALSEKLFMSGVLPYYLHTLDKVEGAAHFDLDDYTARSIHSELNKMLPGYLVPRLVRETPGESSKTLLVI